MKQVMAAFLMVLLVGSFLVGPVAAQQHNSVLRTTPVAIAPIGQMLLELNAEYRTNDDDNLVLQPANIRFGLAPNMEGYAGLAFAVGDAEDELAYLNFGGKVALTPNVSLDVTLVLDQGAEENPAAWGGDELDLRVVLPVQFQVGPLSSIYGQLEVYKMDILDEEDNIDIDPFVDLAVGFKHDALALEFHANDLTDAIDVDFDPTFDLVAGWHLPGNISPYGAVFNITEENDRDMAYAAGIRFKF